MEGREELEIVGRGGEESSINTVHLSTKNIFQRCITVIAAHTHSRVLTLSSPLSGTQDN